jgi:hypothetical protein
VEGGILENNNYGTIVDMSPYEAYLAGTPEGADLLESDMEATLERMRDAPTMV